MGTEGYRERYINPYTDFGFKKLFGTELNKDLLISFLNALLPDGQTVKDVTYLNPEQLGVPKIDCRTVLDVYCENKEGEKFLVEIQKGEQQFLNDRNLFYTTFPGRDQGIKGKEWYYELKSVYIVSIFNFTFDHKNEDYYHREVKLVDRQTKEMFYDKLTHIYLEMPKFNKTEEELVTISDKWMFVLGNLACLQERPAALQERIFSRLFEAAEIARFNRKEIIEYEDSLKNFRDWYSVMKTAKDKGVREGFKQGFEDGFGQAKIDDARKMKEQAIPATVIAKITGLSIDEIEKL